MHHPTVGLVGGLMTGFGLQLALGQRGIDLHHFVVIIWAFHGATSELSMRGLSCLGYAKELILRDIVDYLANLVNNHVTLSVQLMVSGLIIGLQNFTIVLKLLGNCLLTFKSVQFRRQMIKVLAPKLVLHLIGPRDFARVVNIEETILRSKRSGNPF